MEAEMELLRDRVTNQPTNPATIALASMLDAYSRGDATAFNKEIFDYRDLLVDYERSLTAHANELKAAGVASSEILSQPKINFEVFYNQFSPIYYAAVLYVVAFVLGALSWLGWTEPLRRAATWLLCFTLVVHTFALVGRIYISGRPPVTNLYSAAIFIGWAGVVLGARLRGDLRPRVGQHRRFGGRFSDACDRTFPLARRRHVHRPAGRARHAVLAGHARHLHHAGLRDDICRRLLGDRLYLVGPADPGIEHRTAARTRRE